MAEPFHTSKPKAGERIIYEGRAVGTAVRVEGNLCWTKYDASGETLPFIWRFKDGLNALHTWESKSPADPLTYCVKLTEAA